MANKQTNETTHRSGRPSFKLQGRQDFVQEEIKWPKMENPEVRFEEFVKNDFDVVTYI